MKFTGLFCLFSVATAWQPIAPIPRRANVAVRSEEDGKFFENVKGRRGSSVDQDGKSNVWAVEPKMQVEVAAEGEGMKKGGVIAGGAVAAFLAVVAIVTNLPDVDAL